MLSEDVLFEIFINLYYYDILNCSYVCKNWYKASQNSIVTFNF